MKKYLFILLLCLTSCYKIDKETILRYDGIVKAVLEESLPKYETGDTGFVNNNGISIWYEYIPTNSPMLKGTCLLIEGLVSTSMGWGSYFYESLLNEGYNVLRFDNRDVGRSSWTEDLDYDLSDMASDIILLLDVLNIASVHVIGQSMGGMIAQEFVLNNPKRVISLSLIYTSGYANDPELPDPTDYYNDTFWSAIFTYNSNNIEDKIKLELAINEAGNKAKLDNQNLKIIARRVRYENEQRNGEYSNAFKNQNNAIIKSGSRYDRLDQIHVPTLIIHGTDDQLVPIQHGEKLATLIPSAETLWVEGYGHCLSTGFSDIMMDKIIQLIN